MTSSLSSALFKQAPDGTTQLPLFASPNELISNYDITSNDAVLSTGSTHADPSFWDSRYKDSAPSFRESIAKKGVQAPVGYEPKVDESGKITGVNIVDGNHRFAVSAAEHPDRFIPLEYHEYPSETHKKDEAANKAGFPDSHGEFW